jgi:hypothetical protein
LVIALALLLAGCAAETSPTPAASVFFPRHAGLLGDGRLALLEGRLVFADGCIWVQGSAGNRDLILWPSNTTLGRINNLPAVLGPDHVLLAETGNVVRLGGNSIDLQTAQQAVGHIPEACAGEGFWLAGMVENGP